MLKAMTAAGTAASVSSNTPSYMRQEKIPRRELPTVAKKPSTSELLDWLQALRLGGVDPDKIENELPYAGILLKKNEDLTAVKNAKNRVRNGYRW